MIKFFRKITVMLCAVLLAAAVLPSAAFAQGGLPSRRLVSYMSEFAWPDAPELNAEGAYLIELNSGAVLYSKSGSQQFFPASITKILTALVVIERSDLDEMVTFSHNAVHDIEDGGFSYIAAEGDQLSIRDLLYALMLASSNEAAYALAEHIGGSLEGFAGMMNEKAAELGATNSNFVWPHGLTNPEHVTTPHDMAVIMWGAIQNETFLKIDSTITYRTAPTKTNPEGFYCQMRHQMMRNTEYKDERVVAGKTGFISAAGNTLVTYAVDGDKELIAVVMKVPGSTVACEDTKKLLDYGFGKFEFKPVNTGLDFSEIEKKVEADTGRVVAGVSYDDSIDMLLPVDAAPPGELDWELYLDQDFDRQGDEIKAKAEFYFGEKQVAARDLLISLVSVATESADVTDAPSEAADPAEEPAGSTGLSPLMKTIIIIAIVILSLVLVYMLLRIRAEAIRRRRRRQRRLARERERQAGGEAESRRSKDFTDS